MQNNSVENPQRNSGGKSQGSTDKLDWADLNVRKLCFVFFARMRKEKLKGNDYHVRHLNILTH